MSDKRERGTRNHLVYIEARSGVVFLYEEYASLSAFWVCVCARVQCAQELKDKVVGAREVDKEREREKERGHSSLGVDAVWSHPLM